MSLTNPVTGEAHKPIRLGVCVWSKDRRYNDDDVHQTPLGGHVIDRSETGDPDTGEVVRSYRTVQYVAKFGIQYQWITETEIDWKSYNGGVNRAACRDLARRLQTAKGDHLHALIALSNAMAVR